MNNKKLDKVKATLINVKSSETLKLDSLIPFFKDIRLGEKDQQFRFGDYFVGKITDHKNGIVIELFSEDILYEDPYEEFPEHVTREKARLYIYDNGEVYFVSEGKDEKDYSDSDFKDTDYEDVSLVTDRLDKKLGKEVKDKTIFGTDRREKLLERRRLLGRMVKAAIDNIKYEEKSIEYDPGVYAKSYKEDSPSEEDKSKMRVTIITSLLSSSNFRLNINTIKALFGLLEPDKYGIKKDEINIKGGSSYEHGYKVILKDHYLSLAYYEQETSHNDTQIAYLYIFDNGEVYYVYGGEKNHYQHGSDFEDVSSITTRLDARLGEELEEPSDLPGKLKASVKNGDFTEKVIVFDPKVDEELRKLSK